MYPVDSHCVCVSFSEINKFTQNPVKALSEQGHILQQNPMKANKNTYCSNENNTMLIKKKVNEKIQWAVIGQSQ
jgi:hypothetical protein